MELMLGSMCSGPAHRACFICGLLGLAVGDAPACAGLGWGSGGEGPLRTPLPLLRLLSEKWHNN